MPKFYLEYYLKKTYLQILRHSKIMPRDRYYQLLSFYRRTFERLPLPEQKAYIYKDNKQSNRSISEKNRKQAICPSDLELSTVVPAVKLNPKIDVLIPVYKGYAETLRCIYSVLKAPNDISFELVVIDDCSPEPELSAKLSQLAPAMGFTYLKNPQNIGFVQTMNRGMALHQDRDVLWLNSDTEVFDHFLDRLHEIAYGYDHCATVTPFSNNATIASYPVTLQDNGGALLLSDAEIDKIAGELNPALTSAVAAPTGHGFCMYVRRDALNECGLLDECFNLGYGEENDLCQRFIKAGYLNLITPSLFVRHYGSVSFAQKRLGLINENLQKLQQKHPTYMASVADFVGEDPLKNARIRLDAQVWLKQHNYSHSVFHILHTLGGGTKSFVDKISAELNKEGIGSIHLSCQDIQNFSTGIDTSKYPSLGSINFSRGPDELLSFIEGAKVTNIHVHSLVFQELGLVHTLRALKRSCGIKITVTIHDYDWICSSINLMTNSMGYNATYCKDPLHCRCELCDRKLGRSTFQKRLYSELLFSCADMVTVPDDDVASRMNEVFPQIKFTTVPHSEKIVSVVLPRNTDDNQFVVGFLGAMPHIKGLAVAEGLTDYFSEKNVAAKCVIIGSTPQEQQSKTIITGKYNKNELLDIMKNNVPSIWLFAAIWPETYSFTLSEMLATNIPVACFDIGAPAHRMRELGLEDNLIPYDLRFKPKELYAKLQEIAKANVTVPYHGHNTPLTAYYPGLQAT